MRPSSRSSVSAGSEFIGVLIEQCETRHLHDCAEILGQAEAFLENRHQRAYADRNPDLGPHGVPGGSEERLDVQVLPDPSEEPLHLPAAAVEFRHGGRGRGELVGEDVDRLAGVGVPVLHATKGPWVIPAGSNIREHDGLIAPHPGGLVDGTGAPTAVPGVGPGLNDEERLLRVDDVQTPEVQIAPVHEVEGTRFGGPPTQGVPIFHPGVGNVDEGRDVAAQVARREEFGGRIGAARQGPGKHRQAQVDGRCVEGAHGVFRFRSGGIPGVQGPGDGKQLPGKVGVDSPVATPVRIGQRVARDVAPDAHVIEPAVVGAQRALDVAQAGPVRQLGEGHAEKLAPARKGFHVPVAAVTPYAFSEEMLRGMVHDL